MSKFEFGVGEWPMENGCTATIAAIIPQTNETEFDRIGWYTTHAGIHRKLSWNKYGEDGRPCGLGNSRRLVPPTTHEWRNEGPGGCGPWVDSSEEVAECRGERCIGVMERITRPGEDPEYVFHRLEDLPS